MHILHTPLVPTPRMLKACALFGVSIARSTRRLPDPTLVALARDVESALATTPICLIQGSSGSGKSTLLSLLERRLRMQGQRVRRPMPLMDHTSLLDQSAAALDVTIEALSAAGITEPALLIRPPCALSEGQRHRALLAITLLRLSRGSAHASHTTRAGRRPSTQHFATQRLSTRRAPTQRLTTQRPSSTHASRTTTLLIDEFTSTLDPVWATAVARSLPQLLARLHAPIRVVVATSRPDLEIPGCTRIHLPDLSPAAA